MVSKEKINNPAEKGTNEKNSQFVEKKELQTLI